MNKRGVISLVIAGMNLLLFLIVRGPNINLGLYTGMLLVLSSLGIAFAVFSKRWISLLVGTVLNAAGLVIAVSLLILIGITER
ncbi:hypothetical protein H0266_02545 [Halobacillus locisalis]|uniref:Uncharacterized protein n=1 Tax=Halobacillus locisalis TaxID=220753 RepID=A0A838CPK5_9BACI|nr:hypothetical protein [Halobacillus locisalis]MBA2173769.1 hypothetical protein [Halobacillus locisalis]